MVYHSKKGMKNRDRMDIISRILVAANVSSGATKTKIMYKAFLGFSQLGQYLTFLTERDLLSYDLDTQTFKTTVKGLSFLEVYNKIDHILTEQQI
jgi:predicted transcriptional regulator